MSELSQAIQTAAYIRERYEPRPGDGFYLHLSDLRLALDRFRTDEKITLLDYGCGGSPYRRLFPNATYLRADIPGATDLDFEIKEGRLPGLSDAFCDIVLSTEVLEHVEDPETYLTECLRVLKPGGQLICSTHGMYEEHGCPYDFRRWTVGGLRQLLEKVGFTVKEVSRVTTGPRALIFFIDLNYSSIRGPERTLFGFLAAVARYVYSKIMHPLHWQADKFFSENRIAAESDGRHTTYICVLADCRKPA